MAAGSGSVNQYTRMMVEKHKDNESAWIIVKDSIYDVTAFLNDHPGGKDVLLEQAGRDGTRAFEEVGHSSDAVETMKRFKIGELVDAEKTSKK